MSKSKSDSRFVDFKFVKANVTIVQIRLGRLVATPNALAHLTEHDIALALGKHSKSEWGELCADDKRANERALIEGTRLLSVYYSAAR